MTAGNENQNRELVRKMIQFALRRLEDGTVPEKGRFKPCTVQFHIEGTENIAFLMIRYIDEEHRQLIIGVTDDHSGYNISQYDFKGSGEQIAAYLGKDGLEDDWYDRLMKMSEKWTEKLGEYPFYP